MPLVIRPTGLLGPDPHEVRTAQLASRHVSRLELPEASRDPIVQSMLAVRDQGWRPACGGFAGAGYADSVVGYLTSALRIWTGARRREGSLQDLEAGCYLVSVGTELLGRGFSRAQDGEDESTDDTPWLREATMAEDLEADDVRIPEHYRVEPTDLDQVDACLAAGLGLIIGTGTTSAFQRYYGKPQSTPRILTTADMGGDEGGHAERVRGRIYDGNRRLYLVQNSWGANGGALVDGQLVLGCAWVDEGVLREAWDAHCLVLR